MRVTTIKTAYKPTKERCLDCHEFVERGQGYRWVKPRYGSRKVLHVTCRSFKGSELISNDKLSQLAAVLEDTEAQLDTINIDEAADFLSQVAESIREVAAMFEEVANNIEDGFGHETRQSEEFNDNAEQLHSFADDVESTEFEEFDEDEVGTEFLESIEDDDEYALSEFDSLEEQAQFILIRRAEFVAERHSEWEDEVRSAIADTLSASPL